MPRSPGGQTPKALAWPSWQGCRGGGGVPSQWNHSSCLTPQRLGKLTGELRGTCGCLLENESTYVAERVNRPGPGLVNWPPPVCRLTSIFKNSIRANQQTVSLGEPARCIGFVIQSEFPSVARRPWVEWRPALSYTSVRILQNPDE